MNLAYIRYTDRMANTHPVITIAEAYEILKSGKSLNIASCGNRIVTGIDQNGREVSLVPRYTNYDGRWGFYFMSGNVCHIDNS